MTAPAGWYAHPQDQSAEAFWDGAQWTGQTRRKSIPEGWYAHPQDPSSEAFWDGAQWTGAIRPCFTQPAPAQSVQPARDSSATAGDPWSQAASQQSIIDPHYRHGGIAFEEPVSRATPWFKNRKAQRALMSVAAVCALVAGASVVSSRLGTSGAATPKEAGEKLVAAMENGDVLGIIDVLHPAEREALREPFMQGMKQLKRLGITDGNVSANTKLFSFKVENLVIETKDVAEDVSDVFVSGKVISSVNQELKLGPAFQGVPGWEEVVTVDDLMEKVSPGLDVTDSTDLNDAMFAAVKYEGRWYASLGYTVAENIRIQVGAELPAEGLIPQGGSTPEEAVRIYMKAVEALDVKELITGLYPGEFSALQRYAPMFVDDASTGLGSLTQDQEFSWAVSVLELEELSNSGSTASLRVKKIGLDVKSSSGNATVILTHEGTDVKVTIRLDGEEESFSLKEVLAEQRGTAAVPEQEKLMLEWMLSVTVREWNGAWYVAPLSTLTGYMLNSADQLNQADIQKALEGLADLSSTLDTESTSGI